MLVNGTDVEVSCVAFARIVDDQGRLALRRAHKGNGRSRRVVLRPLGGALEGARGTQQYLGRNFGAHGFDDPRELRFMLPNAQLSDAFRWFADGKRREADMRRILTTRLAGQLHVLTALECGRLVERRRGVTRVEAVPDQDGVPERTTAYFVEVYDVTVPPQLLAKLEAASRDGRKVLTFVSEAEIRQYMGPHQHISRLAGSLLTGSG